MRVWAEQEETTKEGKKSVKGWTWLGRTCIHAPERSESGC